MPIRTALQRLLRLAVALPLLLTAAPAGADEVYLKNGSLFEDVVARVSGDQVWIQMPYGGEMSLPLSSVERVVSSESAYRRYLERRQELRAAEPQSPEAWLELARWAGANGLGHAYREALLLAADLQPDLEGLRALMTGLEYVHDPELQRWIPHAEHMRRSGFVLHEGQWLSREEHAALLRLAAEERALAQEAAEREEQQALLRDLVTLTAIQVQQEAAQSQAPPPPQPGYGVLAVTTGWVGHRVVHHRPAPAPSSIGGLQLQNTSVPALHLFARQPGSLIPAVLPRSGGGP